MLKWDGPLDAIRDRRAQGRIPAPVVVRAVLAMGLCRLGSLNALSQTAGASLWRRWLGQALPSADTIGRVAGLIELSGVRRWAHHLYDRLKRNKALAPPPHGLIAAVLDGHETHASYKRCCSGCLQRTIHTAAGDRVQYYHRLVAVSLVTGRVRLMLDAEPMTPGEDEVAAALRLLDRVVVAYPRAFDVVQGDALYADPRLFNWAIDHGKDAFAVLKDDRRDLLVDARRLFEDVQPTAPAAGNVQRECWDLEGFTSWPQVHSPVRVIRSRETRIIRRQLDRQTDTLVSDWWWVTTLSALQASTGAAVRIGHDRWSIENEGFNERANHYHADHVYRHQPDALVLFWLLTQWCLNIFTVFFLRNIKPAARKAVSMLHVARLLLAELYRPASFAPT